MAWLVETAITDFLIHNAAKQDAQSWEIDWLQDPAVEAAIDVLISFSFDERRRNGEYWYSTIESGAWRKSRLRMGFGVRSDHLGGSEAIDNGHLA